MRTLWRMLLVLVMILGASLIGPSVLAQVEQVEQVEDDVCQEGEFSTGALWLICIPENSWNQDVIVFAHGYVPFNAPLDFYNLELPDGTFIPDLVQDLGFAFATTSYRQNGLAILEGSDDIRDLVNFFPEVAGQEPRRVYMTGASEGGIITTLLMEQSPELFSAGLPLCGPVGDFQRQLNYIGDFRLLFDYFFPDVLPGGPTAVPSELIDNWETVYIPLIQQIIADNPDSIDQLIRVSGAAIDPNDRSTIEQTVLQLLWYNAFTTNDAVEKLNGNPYDNIGRQYEGSSNDELLNQSVPRIAADPAALAEVQRYETTGQITKPMYMLHTTGDEIIPIWHHELYSQKVGSSFTFVQGTPDRYGHCNFASSEILVALGVLVLFVNIGDAVDNPETVSIQTKGRQLDSILQEFSRKSGVPMEELREAENQLGIELRTK
ncbi:MAG: hypothetical protein AAGF95_17040 [Chloroflexota bacterium]